MACTRPTESCALILIASQSSAVMSRFDFLLEVDFQAVDRAVVSSSCEMSNSRHRVEMAVMACQAGHHPAGCGGFASSTFEVGHSMTR